LRSSSEVLQDWLVEIFYFKTSSHVGQDSRTILTSSTNHKWRRDSPRDSSTVFCFATAATSLKLSWWFRIVIRRLKRNGTTTMFMLWFGTQWNESMDWEEKIPMVGVWSPMQAWNDTRSHRRLRCTPQLLHSWAREWTRNRSRS
jgi:hypothetical protein